MTTEFKLSLNSQMIEEGSIPRNSDLGSWSSEKKKKNSIAAVVAHRLQTFLTSSWHTVLLP